MRRLSPLALLVAAVPAVAQSPAHPDAATLRRGHNFIAIPVFSQEEDKKILVVPRAAAADVARYARKIIDNDKAGRRELYKKLGLPEDPSVK